MEIIAIANQKGGVGKTTTSINLASCLSNDKYKVLLIDLDPQGNCSQGINVDPTLQDKTIDMLMLDPENVKDYIINTSIENLDLIPANLNLAALESIVKNQMIEEPNLLLKKVIEHDEIKNNYDYVIIDCPPSLSFLSLNALNAANSVLIPIQCEYFALVAVAQILSVINQIKVETNPNLDIAGFLLTMYDAKTTISTEITTQVYKNFKEKTFKTIVPRNSSIPEGSARGIPVNFYKPNAKGSIAYNQLAKEVVNYVKDKEKRSHQ